MAELTLDVARKILDTALAKGVEKKLKPWVCWTRVVAPVSFVCPAHTPSGFISAIKKL